MTDELKQRFIDLLEQDVSQAHEMAQAWKELQEHGARIEDSRGNIIATAADMVTRFTEKEKEMRAFIAKIEEG